MKRKLPILLALCLAAVFTFAGCGGDPAADVKATADGFFSAMQAGDLDTAKTYVTDEAIESGLFDLAVIENFDSELADSMGVSEDVLSDDTKAKLDDFVKEVLESYVTKYEIGEVKVDEEGDKAIALANVTFGFDPEKAAAADPADKLEGTVEDYMKDNEKELVKIFQEKGEEGVMAKMIDDLIDDILDAYFEALKETGETPMDIELTLEKGDDGWKISGFSEAN